MNRQQKPLTPKPCLTHNCPNNRVPRRRVCADCYDRKEHYPRFLTPDPQWVDVCLNCYLPGCWTEGYLGQYCPVNVARRFKLSAPVTLELSKAAYPNQRWQFVAEARKAGMV